MPAAGFAPATPIRSYLAVPLRWRDRTIGALEVDSTEPDAFGPADATLLSRVAASLSGLVEMARRYKAEVDALYRARELDRLKDELISVVSHELRTPLTGIVGFAELLLSRDFSDAQRKQFLQIVLREGERLTSLIDDLLDLQRLESGAAGVVLVPTALEPLKRSVVETFGHDAVHPFVLDLPVDLPLVTADPDRVKQVLANLIENARKYSPNGGEVRISARSAGNFVEIAVIDPGLGIPPEALPRLFEPFYRIEDPTRRGIKGTGLGLAVCRKLVEAHAGRIWVDSPGAGLGSRFCFTLPIIR